MKKIKITLKRVILTIIVLAAVFGIFKFITRDGIKTISVKRVSIQNKQVIKTVSATGKVISNKDVDLSFNSTGKIYNVAIKKGDLVKKGQLLAQLDNSTLNYSIQAAKDARDAAALDKQLFLEQYQDHPYRAGKNDTYNVKIDQYNEALSQAEANYQAKASTFRDALISAPFDGIVVDVLKDAGETAATTETVIKVSDMNDLVFEVYLDQEDFGLVKPGQHTEVDLDSYDKIKFNGNIKTLPLYADGSSTSPLFKLDITLDSQKDYPILLGMTGESKISVLDSEKEVPALMYDEVYTDNENNPYIWVIKNNLITKQSIEIGIEGDVYTEIKTPITDQIVAGVNNDTELKDGYRPQIAK
jgi:HlyD family secretion protein